MPGVGWGEFRSTTGQNRQTCAAFITLPALPARGKEDFKQLVLKFFTSHFIFHVNIPTDFESESITGEAPSPSAEFEKRLWSMLVARCWHQTDVEFVQTFSPVRFSIFSILPDKNV